MTPKELSNKILGLLEGYDALVKDMLAHENDPSVRALKNRHDIMLKEIFG